MERYTVPLTTWANVAVDVEVPDGATPEQIVEAAQENVNAALCHQCSSRYNSSLEIGDVFDPVKALDGEPGEYVYTRKAD